MNLNKLTAYLDSLIERGIPSVDCMVYRNHEEIYRHMNGTTDELGMKPLKGDEIYLMFSMTKVQTMTALLTLIEQGRISLEDEVAKYLPAYQKLMLEKDKNQYPVKTTLKLKHLVSMQSGLDYDLQRPGILRVLSEKKEMASTREIVDSFIETPLKFEPGEHFEYSLSHDVVAAIIEVVTGMRFGEYLKKAVWEPLGMEHTYFAKPVNYEKNLVKQYICTDDVTIEPMEATCNYQFSDNYESGGAGLISCTKDYAILGDAIACGGICANGNRILQPETISILKQNLLCEAGITDIAQKMGRVGYGYGCGMQILMHPEQIHSTSPAGIFGWDGAAGSTIIMDTERKLSVVYTMHVRNCGMAYSEIHPTIRDFVFEI